MKRKVCQVFPVLIVFITVNILFVACEKKGYVRWDQKDANQAIESDEVSSSTFTNVSLEELIPPYVVPPIPDVTSDDVKNVFLGYSYQWHGGQPASSNIMDGPTDITAYIQDITFEKTSDSFPYEYSGKVEVRYVYKNTIRTPVGLRHNNDSYVANALVKCIYNGTQFIFEVDHIGESGRFYPTRTYSCRIPYYNELYYDIESVESSKRQYERDIIAVKERIEKEKREAEETRQKAAIKAEMITRLKLNIITIGDEDLVHIKFPRSANNYMKNIILALDKTSDIRRTINAKNIYIAYESYVKAYEAIVTMYNNKDEPVNPVDSLLFSVFSSQYIGIGAGVSMLKFQMYNINQFPDSIYPVSKKGGEEIFEADMKISWVVEILLKSTESTCLQYLNTSITERTRALKRAATEVDRGNVALFNAIYPTLAKDRNIIVKGFLISE